MELMGLTTQQSGPFFVFLDQMGDERVLFPVDDQWDISAEDIDRTLRHNNMDVDDFWAKHATLYSSESETPDDETT